MPLSLPLHDDVIAKNDDNNNNDSPPPILTTDDGTFRGFILFCRITAKEQHLFQSRPINVMVSNNNYYRNIAFHFQGRRPFAAAATR